MKQPFQICRCGASAVTINARFVEFDCGSSQDDIEGFTRSEKCRREEKADE
jgi:hypothetical protein